MPNHGQDYFPAAIPSILTKAHSETRLLTSPIPPRRLDSTSTFNTTTGRGGGRGDPRVGPEPLLQRSLLVGSSWSSRSSQTLKSVDGDLGAEKSGTARPEGHSIGHGMKRREGSTDGPTHMTVRHVSSNELPTTREQSPLTESLSLEDQALLSQDPGSCDRCRVLHKVFHDLSRRQTAVRQALHHERELNAELNTLLTVLKESGSSVQNDSFETKLLRAHLDLLQNKVQALQEENAQLLAANSRLEEDREELQDLVRKAYDHQPPTTGEDTSSERSNMAAPSRSLDEFSTLAFRDSVYTTSSTASTVSPNRGSGTSDSIYTGDQLGVYAHGKGPIWSAGVLAHLGGVVMPPARKSSLPVNFAVSSEEHRGRPDAASLAAITPGQPEEDLMDKLARGAYKPASTTMIGGSSNYINQLWSPSSPSPTPELGSRSSAARKTLPLNYGSRRRSSEFRRSRSYRDPHHLKRGSTDPILEAAPFTPLKGSVAPEPLTNNPASRGRGGAKGQRKHNNGKSILLCFSRPHTTD